MTHKTVAQISFLRASLPVSSAQSLMSSTSNKHRDLKEKKICKQKNILILSEISVGSIFKK